MGFIKSNLHYSAEFLEFTVTNGWLIVPWYKRIIFHGELIINVDHTPSKYVPASSVAMAEKNSKDDGPNQGVIILTKSVPSD